MPHKYRWIMLLLASYFFYMSWKPKYVILLIISTVVSYVAAILIEQFSDYKKLIVILSGVSELSILFLFKYFTFFFQ